MSDSQTSLPIGRRVSLPGRFDGPVVLESVRSLGHGYECRVRLPDGTLTEAVITEEEAAVLAGAAPSAGPPASPASADELRQRLESARIRLGVSTGDSGGIADSLPSRVLSHPTVQGPGRLQGTMLMVTGALLPVLAWVIGVPFVAVWLFVGTMVFARGRRHFAMAANDLLLKDPRPPVVYLRSFRDDAVATREFSWWWLLSPAWLWDCASEEEHLAAVLNQIGPPIAIGKPGESLPELGAARLYVRHADWQRTVQSYNSRARLVVLRLGQTPGFWWELENALKTLPPEKLVLVVPFRRKEYEAFCAQARGHFAHRWPEYAGSGAWRYSGLKTLRGLIYFQPDWTPVYVDLGGVCVPARHWVRFLGQRTLRRKLTCALRPVAEQLRLAWLPPLPWGMVLLVSLLFPLLFVTLPLLWPEVRRPVGTRRELRLARLIFGLNCLLLSLDTAGLVKLVWFSGGDTEIAAPAAPAPPARTARLAWRGFVLTVPAGWREVTRRDNGADHLMIEYADRGNHAIVYQIMIADHVMMGAEPEFRMSALINSLSSSDGFQFKLLQDQSLPSARIPSHLAQYHGVSDGAPVVMWCKVSVFANKAVMTEALAAGVADDDPGVRRVIDEASGYWSLEGEP